MDGIKWAKGSHLLGEGQRAWGFLRWMWPCWGPQEKRLSTVGLALGGRGRARRKEAASPRARVEGDAWRGERRRAARAGGAGAGLGGEEAGEGGSLGAGALATKLPGGPRSKGPRRSGGRRRFLRPEITAAKSPRGLGDSGISDRRMVRRVREVVRLHNSARSAGLRSRRVMTFMIMIYLFIYLFAF